MTMEQSLNESKSQINELLPLKDRVTQLTAEVTRLTHREVQRTTQVTRLTQEVSQIRQILALLEPLRHRVMHQQNAIEALQAENQTLVENFENVRNTCAIYNQARIAAAQALRQAVVDLMQRANILDPPTDGLAEDVEGS